MKNQAQDQQDEQDQDLNLFFDDLELNDTGLSMAGFEEDEKEDMPESFEEAAKEEVSEFLLKFKARAKEEAATKERNCSTSYWFATYFASEDQRDDFLRKLDLLDKMELQYIDGKTFAKAVGVELTPEEITVPKAFRRPAGIDDLIMQFD